MVVWKSPDKSRLEMHVRMAPKCHRSRKNCTIRSWTCDFAAGTGVPRMRREDEWARISLHNVHLRGARHGHGVLRHKGKADREYILDCDENTASRIFVSVREGGGRCHRTSAQVRPTCSRNKSVNAGRRRGARSLSCSYTGRSMQGGIAGSLSRGFRDHVIAVKNQTNPHEYEEETDKHAESDRELDQCLSVLAPCKAEVSTAVLKETPCCLNPRSQF
jgi:hypothetical protein